MCSARPVPDLPVNRDRVDAVPFRQLARYVLASRSAVCVRVITPLGFFTGVPSNFRQPGIGLRDRFAHVLGLPALGAAEDPADPALFSTCGIFV